MKCNFLLSLLICILSHALLFSQELKHVAIGNQTWMSENLNVETFSNGDEIPEAKTAEEWKAYMQAEEPAWCYYDFDSKNESKYGKLYNWYAVNDPRKIAPIGWRVPTNAEWDVLVGYLGGSNIAGAKLKSKKGWDQSGNGTNSSNFNALPGGFVNENFEFKSAGTATYWWSITSENSTSAWYHCIVYHSGTVYENFAMKSWGFSVRCLKGEMITHGEGGEF